MLRKQNTKYSSSKCSVSYTPANIIRYFIFLIAFFIMSPSLLKHETILFSVCRNTRMPALHCLTVLFSWFIISFYFFCSQNIPISISHLNLNRSLNRTILIVISFSKVALIIFCWYFRSRTFRSNLSIHVFATVIKRTF